MAPRKVGAGSLPTVLEKAVFTSRSEGDCGRRHGKTVFWTIEERAGQDRCIRNARIRQNSLPAVHGGHGPTAIRKRRRSVSSQGSTHSLEGHREHEPGLKTETGPGCTSTGLISARRGSDTQETSSNNFEKEGHMRQARIQVLPVAAALCAGMRGRIRAGQLRADRHRHGPDGSGGRGSEDHAHRSGNWIHQNNRKRRDRSVRHQRSEPRQLQPEGHGQGLPGIRAERHRGQRLLDARASTSS